jgi:hypothetical protein
VYINLYAYCYANAKSGDLEACGRILACTLVLPFTFAESALSLRSRTGYKHGTRLKGFGTGGFVKRQIRPSSILLRFAKQDGPPWGLP